MRLDIKKYYSTIPKKKKKKEEYDLITILKYIKVA